MNWIEDYYINPAPFWFGFIGLFCIACLILAYTRDEEI